MDKNLKLMSTAAQLVKFQEKFVWHHHEAEDKLLLVVKGRLTIRLMDGDVDLEAGELVIIPRGAEHLPWPGVKCKYCCWSPILTATRITSRASVPLKANGFNGGGGASGILALPGLRTTKNR
jgi:hypothetical protein